jgi:hypothetical protein
MVDSFKEDTEGADEDRTNPGRRNKNRNRTNENVGEPQTRPNKKKGSEADVHSDALSDALSDSDEYNRDDERTSDSDEDDRATKGQSMSPHYKQSSRLLN